ncbi:autotransporter domain-containing protein [Bisgaard Taxon 46]
MYKKYKRHYLATLISSLVIPFAQADIDVATVDKSGETLNNTLFSSAWAISGDGLTIGGIGEGSRERSGGAVIWQDGVAKYLLNFGRYFGYGSVNPNSQKPANSAVWAISNDGSTYGGEAYFVHRKKAGFTQKDFKARYPAIWLKDSDSPIRLATVRDDGLGTIKNREGSSTETSGKVNALSADGAFAVGQVIPQKDIYDETAKLAVLWKRGENGWGNGAKPIVLATPFEGDTYYSPSSNALAINHDASVIAGSADWVKSKLRQTSFAKDQRPSIWTSEDKDSWKVTRLPVKEDDNFNGAAHAINADGSIVAGHTQTTSDVKRNQAVVWTHQGDNKSDDKQWNFTYLKSLTDYTAEENDAGTSFAYALNKAGNIIGGIATINENCRTASKPDDNCTARPVVWYDKNEKPIELKTLKADGSGQGAVYALNDEGTIAVGVADTDLNQDGYAVVQKAAVWKITYPKHQPPVTPEPEKPVDPTPEDPIKPEQPAIPEPEQPVVPETPEKSPFSSTALYAEQPTSNEAFYSSARAISGDGLILGGIGESSTEHGGAATIWQNGKATALLNFEGKARYSAVFAISNDGSTYAGLARGSYKRKADGRTVHSKYPAIWIAGSTTPIRLATLKADGLGAVNNRIDNDTQVSGKVNALSADGGLAVGQSIAPEGYDYNPAAPQAVLWKRGANGWENGVKPIHLENPISKADYYTPSADARAISYDGTVIAGGADWIGKHYSKTSSSKDQRPTIWTDDKSVDWKATRLPLETKHNFNGAVNALNHDGSMAVGYTQVTPDVKRNQAVLWKNNGQDKSVADNWSAHYLKSLTNYKAEEHEAASSFAYAINKMGNIIGGTATIDQGCATEDKPYDNCVTRPVIWYDADKKPVQLNTLKQDGSGEGAVYALNDDATIAVGVSDTDLYSYGDTVITKATVWKLTYDKDIPKVSDPVSIIDTREKMGELGANTLASVSSQQRVLSSLANGFDGFDAMDSNAYAMADYSGIDFRNTLVPDANTLPADLNRQNAGKVYASGQSGRVFVRTKASIDNEQKQRSVLAQLNLGYMVNDNFAIGGALFQTPYSKEVNGYKRTSNNLGMGLYAQWKQAVTNGHWYVRSAVALNRYNLEITRNATNGTEQAKGDSKVASKSVVLMAGANTHIFSGGQFGLYTGVRHSDVKQNAYQETGGNFPVSYDQVKFRETAAILGANTSIPLTENLFWEPKLEVEYVFALDNPVYRARAEGIGEVKMQGNFKRLRGDLSSQLRYNITPMTSVDVTPYVGRGASGKTYWGGGLGLNINF